MDIDILVKQIGEDPDCEVFPPIGQPELKNPVDMLPEDLRRFYALCGGANLYMSRDFGFRVVPPTELLPANPILTSFNYEEAKDILDNDISAHWYLLCPSSGPEENIVIDLHPERLGKCYDGYLSIYGTSDEIIVSYSFTEAIFGVLESKGETTFWAGKPPLGFPYENLCIEPPHG